MRLIDAECKELTETIGRIEFKTRKDILSWLDAAPTIDAEPVRHGRWVNKRSSVYCSRCGKGYRNGVGTISALNHNYCPNCGAKMLGGRNEE